jgi:hypothetical protein
MPIFLDGAMDGVGLISATGILRRPIREAPASADDNGTNPQGWQSGSKGGAAARLEMLIGLSGEVIELAIGDVTSNSNSRMLMEGI